MSEIRIHKILDQYCDHHELEGRYKVSKEERVKYRREALKINSYQWMGRISATYEEMFKVKLPEGYHLTYLNEAMKIYPDNEFIQAYQIYDQLKVIDLQSLQLAEQLLMKSWKSISAKKVALNSILWAYGNFLTKDITDEKYFDRYSRIAEAAVLGLDFFGQGSEFKYAISISALGVVMHRKMDLDFTKKFLKRLEKYLGADAVKGEMSRFLVSDRKTNNESKYYSSMRRYWLDAGIKYGEVFDY